MEPPKPPPSPGRGGVPAIPEHVPDSAPPVYSLSAKPELYPGVADSEEIYEEMNPESVEELREKVENVEDRYRLLETQISGLMSSVNNTSSDGRFSDLITRLEASEAANSKTNKLMALLQGDLDEEINNRKQLETEVAKLRRQVQVLQG